MKERMIAISLLLSGISILVSAGNMAFVLMYVR